MSSDPFGRLRFEPTGEVICSVSVEACIHSQASTSPEMKINRGGEDLEMVMERSR